MIYDTIIENLWRYYFVIEPTGRPKSSEIFPEFCLSQKVGSRFPKKKRDQKKTKCLPVGHTVSTFYRGKKRENKSSLERKLMA